MQDFSEKSISPLGSPVIVTVFCDFLVNGSVNLLPSPVIIGKFPAAHATKAAIGWCRSGTRSVVGRGKPKVRFKSKQIAGAGSAERKKIGQCSRCVVWPRRVDPILIPRVVLKGEQVPISAWIVVKKWGKLDHPRPRHDAVRTPEVHQSKEQTRHAAAKGLRKGRSLLIFRRRRLLSST